MAWSIGWDVPAQEPRFSDFSEVARLAKYLGVFDQQTLDLLFGLSGGLIFCSEDLCHHFTPCSRPTKPRFWLPRTSPNTIVWGTLPWCLSSLTVVLLHATSVGKHHILSSFAQKPSNIHKTTLSKPILSPNDATSQWVSHFKVSSAWRAAHSRVCSSTLILTPISGEASHPKNTIQGQAEIPPSAAHGATAVLCSNTSGKMKLRTVYGRWMPLEKQKHKTKRYNAAQVRWDANSWVRTWGLFLEGFFFFPFSFGIPWRRLARRVRAELMPFRGALASPEINRALSQRNLHLPWGFTASQQRFGKRSHLKDCSSWRQRKGKENKHGMNQMKTHHGTQTGNSEFLPSLSYPEQEKDNGWKRSGMNPWFHLFFMFSIQICSANTNKRSWKTTDSLTALAFIQGTLGFLVWRFRHKEEHVFLKKQLSNRLAGPQGLPGLAASAGSGNSQISSH